ncbi:hypothetical protein TWF281_007692 [Arthrobotrys megalospora]
MPKTKPTPYKLIIATQHWSWGEHRHGWQDPKFTTFDCLDDPLPRSPGKAPINHRPVDYLKCVQEVIEKVNNTDEVRGTGFKYFLSNWVPEGEAVSNYSLSLKLGRLEPIPLEGWLEDPTKGSSGMVTPASTIYSPPL